VSKRVDVLTPTSNIDLLPTIASLANLPNPTWSEGEILPQYGGTESSDRTIYTFDAVKNSAFGPLVRYTLGMIKGSSKLIRFKYPEYDRSEFYKLDSDPQELNDLAANGLSIEAQQMQTDADALIEKLNKSNLS
jgi:arylsulfatase A-like enzyme